MAHFNLLPPSAEQKILQYCLNFLIWKYKFWHDNKSSAKHLLPHHLHFSTPRAFYHTIYIVQHHMFSPIWYSFTHTIDVAQYCIPSPTPYIYSQHHVECVTVCTYIPPIPYAFSHAVCFLLHRINFYNNVYHHIAIGIRWIPYKDFEKHHQEFWKNFRCFYVTCVDRQKFENIVDHRRT